MRSLSAAQFMDELCRKSKMAFAREDIVHQVFGPDLNVTFERATPFSLMMNEVLTVIFKRHFAQGRGSKIIITFSYEAGRHKVLIDDDGSAHSVGEEDSDVSTKLIKSLAVQLNADVSWSHVAGAQNEFTATFAIGRSSSCISANSDHEPPEP